MHDEEPEAEPVKIMAHEIKPGHRVILSDGKIHTVSDVIVVEHGRNITLRFTDKGVAYWPWSHVATLAGPAEFPDLPEHPAKFPQRVIDEIAALLPYYVGPGSSILDPFAGVGGIHDLRGHGYQTMGVEIVGKWAFARSGTVLGDATEIAMIFAGQQFDAVVTSPTWGNGLGQRSPHPNAGDGKRYAYADAVGEKLEPTNTGGVRFGKRYRALHETVWAQCNELLRPGGILMFNCRDSPNGQKMPRPVTGWHITALQALGLELDVISAVAARGIGHGERRNSIGDAELIVVMRKPV